MSLFGLTWFEIELLLNGAIKLIDNAHADSILNSLLEINNIKQKR